MASNGAQADDDRQRKINFSESEHRAQALSPTKSQSKSNGPPSMEMLKAESAQLRGQVTKTMGAQSGTRVMTRLEKLQEQVRIAS
jgi:hypothetical protein